MAYSSWALPCPPLIARSPDWLPSSMQTRGRYSMASNPPQLHVARYGWVFLSVASSPRETFGLLMRLNGDDLHSVNCGWCGQRGVKASVGYGEREREREREAGNLPLSVDLDYSHTRRHFCCFVLYRLVKNVKCTVVPLLKLLLISIQYTLKNNVVSCDCNRLLEMFR